MNNKRTIERIATIALAAFLVGYFVYQVAYGAKAIVLTAQSASANWIGGFNCFGEPRCVSGWDHAIVQAQTDWNSGQYAKIPNGGNPNCSFRFRKLFWCYAVLRQGFGYRSTISVRIK